MIVMIKMMVMVDDYDDKYDIVRVWLMVIVMVDYDDKNYVYMSVMVDDYSDKYDICMSMIDGDCDGWLW